MAPFGWLKRKGSPEPRSLFTGTHRAALEDAELACAYAAETGADLPEDVVGKLVAFRRAFDKDPKNIPAEIEAAFWFAASAVAKAVKPATVQALRERHAYRLDGPRSEIGSVVKFYRRLVWLVLLITIVTHFFQVSIDGSLQRAAQARGDFDKARAELPAVALIGSTSPAASNGASANVADPWEILQSRRRTMCRAALEWTTEVTELGRHAPQGKAWYIQTVAIAINRTADAVARWQGMDRSTAQSTLERETFEERYRCGARSEPFDEPKLELAFAHDLGLGTHEEWMIERAANNTRMALSQFVLPFLYGMLGAMASIVRSVSNAVTEIKFVPTSRVLYTLRLPLGALAGATVGLLFEPTSLATLQGLTSLGVAFGLGYAVEIFFAAIDGVVARLSRSAPPEPVAVR